MANRRRAVTFGACEKQQATRDVSCHRNHRRGRCNVGSRQVETRGRRRRDNFPGISRLDNIGRNFSFAVERSPVRSLYIGFIAFGSKGRLPFLPFSLSLSLGRVYHFRHPTPQTDFRSPCLTLLFLRGTRSLISHTIVTASRRTLRFGRTLRKNTHYAGAGMTRSV